MQGRMKTCITGPVRTGTRTCKGSFATRFRSLSTVIQVSVMPLWTCVPAPKNQTQVDRSKPEPGRPKKYHPLIGLRSVRSRLSKGPLEGVPPRLHKFGPITTRGRCILCGSILNCNWGRFLHLEISRAPEKNSGIVSGPRLIAAVVRKAAAMTEDRGPNTPVNRSAACEVKFSRSLATSGRRASNCRCLPVTYGSTMIYRLEDTSGRGLVAHEQRRDRRHMRSRHVSRSSLPTPTSPSFCNELALCCCRSKCQDHGGVRSLSEPISVSIKLATCGLRQTVGVLS